jgi:hypothetical protein
MCSANTVVKTASSMLALSVAGAATVKEVEEVVRCTSFTVASADIENEIE